MCACDADFTCSLCSDTPQDHRYFLEEQDEPEPVPVGREVDGHWQDWR